MNNVYMLNQKIDSGYNAAGKAMRDVFTVFGEMGMKVVPGVKKTAPKPLKALDIPLLTMFSLFKVKKGDYIIYSYPENRIKIRLLTKLKSIKKFKLVCFINDLNSIRSGNLEDESVKAGIAEELSYVACSDIIMAPNENSKKFLLDNGVKARLISVGAWDYLLSDSKVPEYEAHENGPWKVAFAGNLDKAAFLYELEKVSNDSVIYELWGNISKDINSLPSNTVYHKAVQPDELPMNLKGCHFGLVWDGISVDTCDGGLGIYLRYNNSHKCGLYLASNIPVFVWKHSGLADFVSKNKCGYAIESLQEINEILSKITQAEYSELIENTNQVSKVLRKGGLLKKAYERMLL